MNGDLLRRRLPSAYLEFEFLFLGKNIYWPDRGSDNLNLSVVSRVSCCSFSSIRCLLHSFLSTSRVAHYHFATIVAWLEKALLVVYFFFDWRSWVPKRLLCTSNKRTHTIKHGQARIFDSLGAGTYLSLLLHLYALYYRRLAEVQSFELWVQSHELHPYLFSSEELCLQKFEGLEKLIPFLILSITVSNNWTHFEREEVHNTHSRLWLKAAISR